MILPQLATELARLDEDQRAVAAWRPEDGHLRVVASAGSGKSTAAVALVANLIARDVVAAQGIAVTTFSASGAAIVAQRLSRLVPSADYRALRVGTFHAMALRALRMRSSTWNMPQCLDANGKTRAPSTPSARQLWRCVCEYGVIPGINRASLKCASSAREVLSYAALADLFRSRGINHPSEMDDDAQGLAKTLKDFDEAWDLFIQAKVALTAWDFADALTDYADGLRTGALHEAARVVLVDEAQDNSRVQLDLARLIAGTHGRIVLIGDLKQSCHEWRGAYPELFKHADRELQAITLQLRTNYRSWPSIVDVSNRIAQDQPWNLGDLARPHRSIAAYAPITVLRAVDAKYAVAERIRDELVAGARASDYAILCRTNAELGAYQAVFTEYKIPCALAGGTSIFEHREVEVFLCYCILAQRDAYNALDRVLNQPKRYLSREAFMDAVRARSDLGLLQAVAQAGLSGKPHVRRGAQSLHRTLTALRRFDWADVPAEVLKILLPEVRKEDAGEREREILSPDEDRPALYKAAAAIAKRFPNATALYDFSVQCTQNVATVTDGDDAPANRVLLSTIHRAKGSEHPHIIFPCNAAQIPHKRAQSVEAQESERRLFYIAVTRAMDRLTFVYDDDPSPFLLDVLRDAVDQADEAYARMLDSTREPAGATTSAD